MLRVIQDFIPWHGHWRRHFQFISVKVQGNGARLPVLQEGFAFAGVKTNTEFL